MAVPIKPLIYQLVVRYFGNTLAHNQKDGTIATNGVGRFSDINAAAIRGLQQLGVTHVWLCGVLRQATTTDYSELGLPADPADVVKGRAGSFFAIRDYFDVCPDYARRPGNRREEFRALIKRLHDAQLRVLIDLVPNHVARTYESVVRPALDFGRDDDTSRFFARDNAYFYLVDPPGRALRLPRIPTWSPTDLEFTGRFAREDGGLGRPPRVSGNNVTSAEPSASDWYETVKLNYGFDFVTRYKEVDPIPRTWGMVDSIIEYWQTEMGVDGFRCDFAHYVPEEAWRYLILRARQRDPSSVFIAEAYPWVGSGDPVESMEQLVAAGFDAVYDDSSYDQLKRIYRGDGSLDDYANAMETTPALRVRRVEYLENHDERRVASPIVLGGGPGCSGFGSLRANYQLAPLQLLAGNGPVIVFNGQEVGEPGAQVEGFGGDDGRTTIYDYWTMPEFAKWVNEHAYDGAGLSDEQQRLRQYYGALGALCQHSCVRADGYWNLRDMNRDLQQRGFYGFARYEPGGGKMLLVVANFRPGGEIAGEVRISSALAESAGLRDRLTIRCLLGGSADFPAHGGSQATRGAILREGLTVRIPDQWCLVLSVDSN